MHSGCMQHRTNIGLGGLGVLGLDSAPKLLGRRDRCARAPRGLSPGGGMAGSS